MQLGAPGIDDAVDRPNAAILGEVRSMGGMPVLCVGDRGPGIEGSLDLGVHQRHDVRGALHRQASGRVGKVVLQVNDHERNLWAVPSLGLGDGPGVRLSGSPAAGHIRAFLRRSRRMSVRPTLYAMPARRASDPIGPARETEGMPRPPDGECRPCVSATSMQRSNAGALGARQVWATTL